MKQFNGTAELTLHRVALWTPAICFCACLTPYSTTEAHTRTHKYTGTHAHAQEHTSTHTCSRWFSLRRWLWLGSTAAASGDTDTRTLNIKMLLFCIFVLCAYFFLDITSLIFMHDQDTYHSCSEWQGRPLVERRSSALLWLDALVPAQVISARLCLLTQNWVCDSGSGPNPDLADSDRWQGFASGLFGCRDFGDHVRLQGRGCDSRVPHHSCGRLQVGRPTAGARPQTPAYKGNLHCWIGSARVWNQSITDYRLLQYKWKGRFLYVYYGIS